MSKVDDWLSRVVIPDVYPRRDDPFRPSAAMVPGGAPGASYVSPEELNPFNIWDDWITTPANRPIVYQRCLNFMVTANVDPVPLTNGNMQCDAIVLDILSTSAVNAFVGFGSGVNTASGIEIRAGLPIVLDTNNTREMWELQRVLEAIAGMLATDRGLPPIGTYRAPRVVFDASEYFVVAASAVTVRVMLFLSPEYQ